MGCIMSLDDAPPPHLAILTTNTTNNKMQRNNRVRPAPLQYPSPTAGTTNTNSSGGMHPFTPTTPQTVPAHHNNTVPNVISVKGINETSYDFGLSPPSTACRSDTTKKMSPTTSAPGGAVGGRCTTPLMEEFIAPYTLPAFHVPMAHRPTPVRPIVIRNTQSTVSGTSPAVITEQQHVVVPPSVSPLHDHRPPSPYSPPQNGLFTGSSSGSGRLRRGQVHQHTAASNQHPFDTEGDEDDFTPTTTGTTGPSPFSPVAVPAVNGSDSGSPLVSFALRNRKRLSLTAGADEGESPPPMPLTLATIRRVSYDESNLTGAGGSGNTRPMVGICPAKTLSSSVRRPSAPTSTQQQQPQFTENTKQSSLAIKKSSSGNTGGTVLLAPRRTTLHDFHQLRPVTNEVNNSFSGPDPSIMMSPTGATIRAAAAAGGGVAPPGLRSLNNSFQSDQNQCSSNSIAVASSPSYFPHLPHQQSSSPSFGPSVVGRTTTPRPPTTVSDTDEEGSGTKLPVLSLMLPQNNGGSSSGGSGGAVPLPGVVEHDEERSRLNQQDVPEQQVLVVPGGLQPTCTPPPRYTATTPNPECIPVDEEGDVASSVLGGITMLGTGLNPFAASNAGAAATGQRRRRSAEFAHPVEETA